MTSGKLKFDVDMQPSYGISIALAVMHILVIFDGIVFIPNVLAKSLNIPAGTLQFVTFTTILISAIATFLQSRRAFGIGAGYILFAGSYSAFLVCSLDAVKMGGFALLGTMTLLSVPLIFLYTYFIRFFRHIITPAVGGVVILLVAISLVPVGLEIWAGEGVASYDMTVSKLTVGGVTALSLTVCMLFGSTLLKLWSPLISLACGYIAAALTGQLHFEYTYATPWLGLPPMEWPGLATDLSAAHLPLLLAFMIAMLASMIENTGNIMLVQQLSHRDFRRVSYDRVQGGLYCDGLSKAAAGAVGTAVPSVYCDNLPLIEMTGVASRRIGVCGAGILLLLAFMPKVSAFMLDMPGPVLGGFLIVIASLLFHAGIGLISVNKLSNQHGIIVGLSLMVGLVAESGSYFGDVVPDSLAPVLQSSIAVGGFTAFFLSALAYVMPKRALVGTYSAAISELTRLQELLSKGRGKLKMTDAEFDALSLCCEEVFCYMVEQDIADADRKVSMRVSRQDDELVTEIVCGHEMDDINNFAVPDSFFHAKGDELRQLGMVLFANFAKDVKQLDISGYSFISFKV